MEGLFTWVEFDLTIHTKSRLLNRLILLYEGRFFIVSRLRIVSDISTSCSTLVHGESELPSMSRVTCMATKMGKLLCHIFCQVIMLSKHLQGINAGLSLSSHED